MAIPPKGFLTEEQKRKILHVQPTDWPPPFMINRSVVDDEGDLLFDFRPWWLKLWQKICFWKKPERPVIYRTGYYVSAVAPAWTKEELKPCPSESCKGERDGS